jgi:N,N-dimethylformamidase
MPTLRSLDRHETVLAVGELRITIHDGQLYVRTLANRVPTQPEERRDEAPQNVGELLGRPVLRPVPVTIRRWHWLAVGCDGTSVTLDLRMFAGNVGELSTEWSQTVLTEEAPRLGGIVTIAASPIGVPHAMAMENRLLDSCFNGRIELPWIANVKLDAVVAHSLSTQPGTMAADPRVVGAWDFSHDISGDRVPDLSSNQLHGHLVNHPTRAVRGVRWDGSAQDWTRQPRHYGAVHFHSDDLTDAVWAHLFEWTIPDDLRSGIYAVKLENDDECDYVPFFVRPSPTQQRAEVVFLVPTATYLAYANNRFPMYAAQVKGTRMRRKDSILRDHPELGWSLYERHADGSGVHYSSYLRPVLDLRPCDDAWGFTADTNIAAWLHRRGVAFDVVTDEDLHREGAGLVAHYKVVITGTHPEYASTRMLDALEGYLAGGGRLMYMGGNGFYWRIAYHPDNPAIIELRRAEGRGRAWDSEPGEYYHSFTGEYGGLWRNLGRPPNRLVGVGFVALGGTVGTSYRRESGAADARAEFVFRGTREGLTFGAYGTLGGGAVSQEIDRWNRLRGSPDHALVLASSVDHPADFILAHEETTGDFVASDRPRLRGDMVFFETPSGGAVFSAGSIGFAGALAHNGYENDICQIANNVLGRFVDPAPFVYPAGVRVE